MSDTIINGVFQTEIKNRFLCTVRVNNEDVTCYIPSSCRLGNFIKMEGRSVLLKPVTTPNARTAFSVYAIKYGRRYILVNLAQTNRVIEEQLHRRYFSFLGKRKKVSREYKVGDYKSDLYIHDTRTIVEIKSTLAFEQEAVFPTVYSERAVKQLRKISALLDEGYNACYILVSLNPSVQQIRINEAIDDFHQAFLECVQKGMAYRAFSIRLHNYQPELYSKITIKL